MKPRLSASPKDLLTALLDACRRGLVSHEEAAKLIGIRKAELGDLVAWRMVEAAVWRCYVMAFHHTFPECDPHLYRVPPVEPRTDDLMRGGRASECNHYTAEEAESLQPSQPHIIRPELEIGDAWENIEGTDDRSPAHLPRALPRDTGQQLFHEAA